MIKLFYDTISSSLTSHVTSMILTLLFRVGYEVLSSPLPLGQWLRLLGFWSSLILSIPMMSHLLQMRSCHTSLDHLFSGVLILGSRLLRFLRPHICFLELRVIPCGLFLISTQSLWSDVCFSMLLCLVRPSVFLTCSFIL